MVQKDKTTALILSILGGGLGLDRFYLGYIGMGVLKLLTAGCFGILYIIDIIHIATGTLKPFNGEYIDEIPANRSVQNGANAVADLTETLRKMAALHDDGVISDEEFAKMKADVLAKM